MDSQNLEKTKDMPAFKIKVGNIDLAVWENQSEKGPYFTVSYNKSYLDKNNQWQKTNNLLINDIPNLQIALSKAYEKIKVKE